MRNRWTACRRIEPARGEERSGGGGSSDFGYRNSRMAEHVTDAPTETGGKENNKMLRLSCLIEDVCRAPWSCSSAKSLKLH